MTVLFEEWVQTVFDHLPKEPQWYFDEGFDLLWDSLGLSDVVTVKYLTRLFLEPEHLKPYSLAQVAQGIWFLIGESSPGEPSHALIEPGAALADRIAGIQGMAKFFRNFVASAACGPADTESDPFHIACYMWWDMLPFRPFRGEPLEGEPELHSTCLKVMTEMLDLPSELCQLSALHGLNHWHEHYAEQVEGIIDTFLGRTGNVTPCIREYAAKARAGLCQ